MKRPSNNLENLLGAFGWVIYGCISLALIFAFWGFIIICLWGCGSEPTAPYRVGQFSRIEYLHDHWKPSGSSDRAAASYLQVVHGARTSFGEVLDLDTYVGTHYDSLSGEPSALVGVGGGWYGSSWSSLVAIDQVFSEEGDLETIIYGSFEVEW